MGQDAIRQNKPYNQFVYELVTAEGHWWDNGAVGYYMRDAGMPLDNMSNTIQVFLGTQMVCAQCHNHPFDRWTQKEYYELAAFTYGVETRIRPEEVLNVSDDLDKDSKKREGRQKYDRNVRRALNEILEPLSFGATESQKTLKLPHDYKYDDGKPGEAVDPEAPFAQKLASTRGSERDKYAKWITSDDNPRFTKVIVNRLWKRVMGVGLIEPVDDFKDDTEATNPQLLDYLVRTMQRLGYDQRKFLEILYNTRTYQREAFSGDYEPTDYHFPGPVLQRLTAEQMWDSLLTLTIPDPDAREGQNNNAKRAEQTRERAKELLAMGKQRILALANEVAKHYTAYDEKASAIRAELTKAQAAEDDKKVADLRKQLRQADGERDKAVKELMATGTGEGGSAMMASAMMEEEGMSLFEKRAMERQKEIEAAEAKKRAEEEKKRAAEAKKAGKKVEKPADPDAKWKGYDRNLVRASELPSPAPNNHFVRVFGQSDRDTIENASTEPSVPQVLELMNGQMYNQVTAKNSVLMQRVAAAKEPEQKVTAIFLSMFNRQPNERERELAEEQFYQHGDERGALNLVWALLNSREFAFVQ
ncbi:MAG: DUF1553 domain-containing protein [Verrucomicrobiales bacterium]